MSGNLTILKKGLVLVAIPFLFQIAFLGLLIKTYSDGARAQHWALHSKEVIAKVEGTFRRLVEAHSGIRGLILTGEQTFYDQAERALRQVPAELSELQSLVSDNPTQQAKARDIAGKSSALMNWQEETARLVRNGDRESALERVKNKGGKLMLDDVRVAIDEFLATETRLDVERSQELATTAQHQWWALGVGGALAVIGVVILASIFGRGITTRFAVLAGNAQRLADGKDLARPLLGRDEIAQLDRVFHSMARVIAEKNRENELFIYSVSHDLRSPLVNLQGFSQELGHASKELRGIVDGLELPQKSGDRAREIIDEDIAGSIHFIQTAVARLSAIIDALLRLSRAGRVEYRWQEVDVSVVVSRVIEALNSTIAERGAKVTADELPPAWGDPTAVEQIFANLIGNAVNYLDPKRPGRIEVGVLNGAPSAVRTYYVKDNGRGIPESGMAKLFLAFQRFHDGAAKGEGIGLALVRRIVERHGGKIRVESQSGVGTTFYVELPTQPPETGDHESAPRILEATGTLA